MIATRHSGPLHARIAWTDSAPTQQRGQAAKHLRLSPAMHRNLVPTDVELPSPKGAIILLPTPQKVCDNICEKRIEFRESTRQQHSEVDAFGIVVQFPSINGESRSLRERDRQALRIEQPVHVVFDSTLDRIRTPRTPRESFDFAQSFEDETGVKVIHEAPVIVSRIWPRAVCLLSLEHEHQISSPNFQILLVGEIQCGLRQEECPVCARVHDSTPIVGRWRVRAARAVLRRRYVTIRTEDVAGDGSQDTTPLIVVVDPMDSRERLIDIRNRCYEGSALADTTGSGLPIEGIAPTVILIVPAASLFQHVEKVDSPVIVVPSSKDLCEIGKAHRIVSVRYWKTLRLPEQFTGSGQQ